VSIDLSQFHQIFYEESFEGLELMESCLLNLDCDNLDSETINSIFRAAHSIKGSGGTFGFVEVTEFTHVLETLLDQIRNGSRKLELDHVELLLQSVDCLREMLTELKAKEPVTVDKSHELMKAFNEILDGDKPDSQAETVAVSSDNTQTESAVSGESIWQIIFIPDAEILKTGNEPLRIFRELQSMGSITVEALLGNVPTFSEMTPEDCYIGWNIQLETTQDKTAIEEVFEWVVDESDLTINEIAGFFEKDIDIEPLESKQGAPEIDEKVASSGGGAVKENEGKKAALNSKIKSKQKNAETTSIRVGTDKIDSLVNLVGELVITQSMLGQLGNEFDMDDLTRLQEGLAQLEHNTRELQESVLRIRMLPISFSFSRFPRMVRDLSKQLGKKVELVLSGEQTELDKTVLENIGDPMVHLVRNSLDHGFETPEERVAAGKPETGTLTLNAYHQGGNIVIEISDDGKGLDHERIRQKAIANGLILESDTLSEEQVNGLIFHPGLSTSDEVTDVSGRGVGMDVVRRNIQELNGTIEVKSEQGKGSVFTVRLPLTLAILDGQLIKLGQQTYIIPLVSIIESLQPDPTHINHVAGGVDVFRLRDDYIPIVKLWEVFGEEPESRELGESLLVVLEAGSEKVALVVDDLLGQQQVVIKSMETNYKKVEGLSGATILGDGTVSLILDIADIISMANTCQQDGKAPSLVKDGHHAASLA